MKIHVTEFPPSLDKIKTLQLVKIKDYFTLDMPKFVVQGYMILKRDIECNTM